MTTKFTADVVHKLLGVREAQQAPSALMGIVMDKQKRNKLFKQFLDLNFQVKCNDDNEFLIVV